MPELAEVDFFRRRWDAGLRQRVRTAAVHEPARVYRGCDVPALVSHLTGATLAESFSHGKQLLFRFSGGAWLGVHLGMTGDLRTEPAGFTPGRHDHLVLHQARQALVFSDARMFGRIRFDLGRDSPEWWQKLPPAVLADGFTAAWLGAQLQRRPKSPVKAVLLDQAIFPGIGNWMADEILWRLRWHPLRAVTTLSASAVADLRRETRRVARGALETIGTDWSDPPASWLYTHRWASDNACPRCGTVLTREEAAGRTTCWCPACQPGESRPTARPVRTGHRREKP